MMPWRRILLLGVVSVTLASCGGDDKAPDAGSAAPSDAAASDEGPTLEEIQKLWGGDDEVLSITSRRTETVQGQETYVVSFEVLTDDARVLDCGARFSLGVRDEWVGFDEDCDVIEILGFGTVETVGDSLPPLTEPTDDPAIGLTAPTLTGQDATGNPIEIGPDGQRKVVVILSHSSNLVGPEIVEIQSVIDSAADSAGVAVYGIHTWGDPDLRGWPPRTFLDAAGWTSPTLIDDEANSAAEAYGIGGIPTYIVLDGSNGVLARVTGTVRAEGFNALLDFASN